MTTATLRAPARWTDAVRAELRILASARHLGWIAMFLCATVIWGTTIPATRVPFSELRQAALLMFLLPVAWQGCGGRERHAPLPIADAAHEVVRVFCGAAFAGSVLALGTWNYVRAARSVVGTGIHPLDVFPPSYPAALTLAGVASYLLGAALTLRSERPGRTVTTTLVLVLLGLAMTGIQLERVEIQSVPYGEMRRRYAGGSSLTVTASLAWLAVGTCAVCASAWLAGLRLPGWRISLPRLPRGAAAATRPRPFAPGIRAPASLATVFGRQVRLLGPRMVLPLLALALHAWLIKPREVTDAGAGERGISAEPFLILWFVAYMWPVLVWMDERQPRPWDDARPADTVVRRLAHAAAGMAWLLAGGLVTAAAYVSRAVDAGVLSSPLDLPAWLVVGLPLALVALYCLGTVSAVLGEPPILAGLFTGLLIVPLMMLTTDAAGIEAVSLVNLFTPLGWMPPYEWSPLGALIWTPVLLAAAAWAIRRRARQEREEKAWPLPEPLAVPPNLWYGRRRRGLA